MENGSLMKDESIVECSLGKCLQKFIGDPLWVNVLTICEPHTNLINVLMDLNSFQLPHN